jgi:hypothetical protein
MSLLKVKLPHLFECVQQRPELSTAAVHPGCACAACDRAPRQLHTRLATHATRATTLLLSRLAKKGSGASRSLILMFHPPICMASVAAVPGVGNAAGATAAAAAAAAAAGALRFLLSSLARIAFAFAALALALAAFERAAGELLCSFQPTRPGCGRCARTQRAVVRDSSDPYPARPHTRSDRTHR